MNQLSLDRRLLRFGAAVLALITVGFLPADAQPSTTRVGAGGDTVADAIDVSAGFADGTADWVVLARDDAFGDNFGAASVAGGEGPVLFTPGDALPAAVSSEIDRVLAGPGQSCASPAFDVFVMGGTNAISDTVIADLRGSGYCVQRVVGTSRFETALAAAQVALDLHGGTTALLVEASMPQHLVPAAAWAGATGTPVLVTSGSALHPAVIDFLEGGSIDEITIVGSTQVISADVEDALPDALVVDRLDATDPADLAVLALEQLWGRAGAPVFDTLTLMSSADPAVWAAALAAGQVPGSPALVVGADALPFSTCAAIRASGPDSIRAVGGTDVVPDAVLNDAVEAADPSGTSCQKLSGQDPDPGPNPPPPPSPSPSPSPTPGDGADLSLSVAGGGPIRQGEAVDFVVTVANRGPNAAEGTLTVQAPDDVALSGAGCSLDGDALVCPVGTIDPEAAVELGVSTTHGGIGDDLILFSVDSPATDPNPADNADEIVVSVSPGPASAIDGGSAGQTARLISQQRFGDAVDAPTSAAFAQSSRFAEFVVLSRDDNFADSLAGTVLTGSAPLLFTDREMLDPDTAEEIDRVLGGSGTVYLLGGTAALSAGIMDGLSASGYTPVRLEGPSRVETAVAIATEARRVLGAGQREVGLARAFGVVGDPTAAWADSISGGGWAARTGTPILLTPTDSVHTAVAGFLAEDAPGRTVLLGGTAALSNTVEAAVPNPQRISGAERAATAVAIAGELRSVGADRQRQYLLINGRTLDGWIYGLAAAGLSADRDAPLLMVEGDRIPGATRQAVTGCVDVRVGLVAVGGEAQVPATLLAELDALDDGPC